MTKENEKRLNPVYQVNSIKVIKKEMDSKYDNFVIRSPHDVAQLLIDDLYQEDREIFVVLTLNVKNRVTSYFRCHVGALNQSLVSPREVFKTAILQNSASIIVAHNHPSGDTTPSPEDIQVTERLQEGGQILGIQLLDHIIIGDMNFISLKEKGYLQ